MRTLANALTRGDDYLISKFGKLQRAALCAQVDIRAISGTAGPDDEHEAILWALAPVERLARLVLMLEPSTRAGVRMLERARAWLNGGDLDCLLEPMEQAA
ncbi:hypothetical protein IVB14_17705 [Bradyrhizobium sp. 180]|uniref:hypothetical protein n=1 Tax=Bradyrhizobium sp. 180 TaxID=2782650 RepID=UPI001FF74A87|nr:hypothetical protein [Bradyrhizobium sp. 180]MCK1492207.1 hypothetical protein [Bradyrhizobium sp. 180]